MWGAWRRKHMRYIFIIFTSVVLGAISPKLTSTLNLEQDHEDLSRQKYHLVFYDDFNNNTLDSSHWKIINRQHYAWAKYMSSYPALYQINNSCLRLSALLNNGLVINDTATFLTGGVTTQGLHAIHYGKVEIRARFHGAIGSWPALWMLRTKPDETWPNPRYAEIDIVEYVGRGNTVMHTVHNYHTMHLKNTDDPPHTHTSVVDPSEFNVYTVEILPEKILFSINGKTKFEYPKRKGNDIRQYPFGTDMFLMMDMQVGASWIPEIDNNTFPAYMDIDWVKMYKLSEK